MSSRNFRFVFVLFIVFLAWPAFAQDEPEAPLLGPINSDPLTVRGISPRVLDIALFPMSQGLYWEMLLNYQSIDEEGIPRSERFRMIFDPYTDYGRDLYFEFENEPLQSVKRYKRSLEVTMGKDNYVRKKRRLYDPTSFQVREISEGHEVISFRYDKERVPSSLRWLIFLIGEVHVIDGVLDRIEFTAEKTIERDGVRNRISSQSWASAQSMSWVDMSLTGRKRSSLYAPSENGCNSTPGAGCSSIVIRSLGELPGSTHRTNCSWRSQQLIDRLLLKQKSQIRAGQMIRYSTMSWSPPSPGSKSPTNSMQPKPFVSICGANCRITQMKSASSVSNYPKPMVWV